MFKIVTINNYNKVIANCFIPINTILFKESPNIIGEDIYDVLYKLYNDENNISIFEFKNFAPCENDRYIIKYDNLLKDINTLPFYIKDFFIKFNKEELELLCAKFYRNAFKYNDQCAILKMGRLLNHSCCNNVDFYIEKNGEYVFKTNRDIYNYEELTDKYIDTNLSTEKRQKELLSRYGFICKCKKCLS